MIQIDGCHSVNPVNGSDTGIDRWLLASKTIKLEAGVPGVLELGLPILTEGPYRNTVASPVNGALLRSSGEGWTGYEPLWVLSV